MNIKKIGHCCLIIKEKDVTILTDPGMFTTGQNEVVGIDVVLITHEHADHLHIDSLKKVLQNNPNAKVVTNTSVGKILEKENILYSIVGDGQEIEIKDVVIVGKGTKHAVIYKEMGLVENTGYLINKKLFYPGDAFYNPQQPVDILALPVAGPWVKIAEAIEYALALKPKHVFPVHDGVLNQFGVMGTKRWTEKVFTEAGIAFHALKESEEIEL